MKLYAERLPAAIRQLLTDIIVVVWIYLWIRAGLWVHQMVEKLAVPGQKLQSAGSGIANNLADAGSKAGQVPLIGDQLVKPFNGAAEAARSLAGAGVRQQEIVDQLALIMTILALSVPRALALFLWLPRRLRWMRRAGASSVRGEPAGRDLLALRELASRPLNELAKLGPDIAQSWRSGDAEAVDALELKRLGLSVSGRRS